MPGTVAGYITGDGRPYICFDNVHYAQCRLAWFYVTGVWPQHDIDHKDGDHANNRFSNLRDVTESVNMQNQRDAHADAKIPLLGVSAHQGKFRARVYFEGKNRHVGLFETPEAAHLAYVNAKRALHTGCTI